VSPLRGEKPQNRPLSKLNTGRLALRAMLPVMKKYCNIVCFIRYQKYCYTFCGNFCCLQM